MTMYSEEHRADLLERAYRRGYELRLRRRRWLATFATIAVIVVAGGSAIAASHMNDNPRVSVGQSPSSTATTSTSPSATTCAASISVVPRAKVPHDVAAWAQGAVVGNGALWTRRANIDVPGSHQSNIWRVKFPWYTRPFGLPAITGRRLDGTGTFHAEANPATDSRGTWVVSSLEFSRPGCWQVTGRYRSSTIRFRMHILANAQPASSAGLHTVTGETFGPLPDFGSGPFTAADYAQVPDYVSVANRDGVGIAGYVKKTDLWALVGGQPVGNAGTHSVFADGGSPLVGHVYACKGFVALNEDPRSIPDRCSSVTTIAGRPAS
jgi:hypothetical protein